MGAARSLVVVRDEVLLDDVLRLAAAAGVEVEVASDPGGARSRWSAAPFVVLGAEDTVACARAELPRRAGVVAVTGLQPTPQTWQQAMAVGAEEVIVLPDGEAALVQRFGDAALAGPGTGRVVCCVGGCGGAGASVLAVGLAVAAGARGSALLVDLDPHGGGLDLTLGVESVDGLRWPDLRGTSGRVSAVSLAAVLPGAAGVSLLSVARASYDQEVLTDTAREVVEAGRRSGAVVVVDLPRVLTPAAQAAARAADAVLLLVPTEVRACVAAAVTARGLAELTDRTRLVTRARGSGRIAPEEIARSLRLPLAAAMRSDPRLTALVDSGELLSRHRGGFVGSCRDLLADVFPVPRRRSREAA